jgi:hypothetical protein
MHTCLAIWIYSWDFNSRLANLASWFRWFSKPFISSDGILLQRNLQSCAGENIWIQRINWIRYETASIPVDEAILHVIGDEESRRHDEETTLFLHCVINRCYGTFLISLTVCVSHRILWRPLGKLKLVVFTFAHTLAWIWFLDGHDVIQVNFCVGV